MKWPWSRPDPVYITTKSLVTPESWLKEIFGITDTVAGVAVTPKTALQYTPVRCAVAVISEPMGLPLHVYKRNADGSKEKAKDHPVQKLLAGQANSWTPATDFREQLGRDALLWGNGYAYILRGSNGVPEELFRLEPASVEVSTNELGEPFYKVKEGATERILSRSDVLHLKAPSMDGLKGESLIDQAREAISLGLVMEQSAARLFKNGGRPSGVLKFPVKLGDDTAERIGKSWRESQAGANSGGTAVLEEGGEFQQLSFTSVDSQFLEMRQFAVTEIARVFRVPPVFLMDYGRATWSNNESQGSQLVTYTLARWFRALQGEIHVKLFSEEERSEFFVEYLVDDLLRADTAARMEAYAKAISARVLNPNEARAMENRPPFDGGDEFINPNTMTAAQAAPEKEAA